MNNNTLESFINFCDNMQIANESKVKIIDKKNPNGCGYPCSNLTINGINVSIMTNDNEKEIPSYKLQYLEKNFPIIKKNYKNLFEMKFIPWVLNCERTAITKDDCYKGLKLYDIEFNYNQNTGEARFEFDYEAIPGSICKKEIDAITFQVTIKDYKIIKTSTHNM